MRTIFQLLVAGALSGPGEIDEATLTFPGADGFRERRRQQLMAEFGADPVAPDFTDLLGMFSEADFERAERELFPDGGAGSEYGETPADLRRMVQDDVYIPIADREVKDEL